MRFGRAAHGAAAAALRSLELTTFCLRIGSCGQRAAYELGMTGVPVYNVNNNCSTASTALMMARQVIEGGLNQWCVARRASAS